MPSYPSAAVSLVTSRAANPERRQTSYGMMFGGRAAEVVAPGQLAVDPQGADFAVGGRPAWTMAQQWALDNGFRLRLPALEWQGQSLDVFNAQVPPAWVLKNFTYGEIPATAYSLQATRAFSRLLDERLSTLKIIPSNVFRTISVMLTTGMLAVPSNSAGGLGPIWADTPAKQAAWAMVVTECQGIIRSFDAANMQRAASEGEVLLANAEFWDKAVRATLAVATLGVSELSAAAKEKWDELQDKLATYRATRKAALEEASNPATAADRAALLRKTVADLDSTIMGKMANAGNGAPNLAPDIAPSGLGIAPIAIFTGLTIAAQIGILVAIIAAVVYAIKTLNDLGVFAVATSVGSALKLLSGPVLGVVVLGGLGWWFYNKHKRATR